ncbi:protein NRT1/ PTR FAMILY 5.10-like [Zingiber officinale]|uniref:protein NRT1/ PTR FAMILY 5.10-like n=1 Tax=Zingiber officinale TaxID=94328 RepID=UPI001C4C08E0|nr:protein NRT1/ PTR FAMILY 5.10-like [Zingiber officinale]
MNDSESAAPPDPRHRSGSSPVYGAVDHRGRPVARRSSGQWTSAFFIIGMETAERSAYYGVSSNLINYLSGPLREKTAVAAAAVNTWAGVTSALPVVAAFLADAYLGRYWTIVVASILYVLGLGLLTLSSVLPTFHPLECNIDSTLCSPSKLQLALFYFSLYLVAVAQAGQKPCLQAFGADQFDDNDPEECNLKSSFFNWWTFCLIAGSTIATICLNYVQDNVSWVVGFGVSWVFMALGLLIFLLGTGTYRFYNVGHGKNPVSGASKALFTLFKKWQVGSEQEESRQALLSKAPDLANEADSTANNVDGEEAKGLFRLFPIWASCLIYAVVLSQASTFFTKQGSTMDRRLGSKFQVPSASLQCFIGISAIAFIPVYDRLLVPLARRFTGEPSGITMLQRIGTGVALSVVVMLVAAFVEMKRLRTCREMGLVDLPDEVIPMSMWWLMPQNVLCGIANVFTVVGLQEFFYDQVPEAFRSLGLAFCLSIFGVGNFISGFIVSAINLITSSQGGSWFPDNLNRAHLDYFYLLLAGLSAVELLIFLCSAQFYVYKTKGNPAM